MSLTVLAGIKTSRCALILREDDDYGGAKLWAGSMCCTAPVHWPPTPRKKEGDGAHCSSCLEELIVQPEEAIRSAYNIGSDTTAVRVREWAAIWLGLEEEELRVRIEW